MINASELYVAYRNSRRIKITTVHFMLSLLVNLLIATFVVLVWYPPPFLESSGGFRLLLQVICIDVVLGTFLVCLVSKQEKRKSELVRDLAIIISMQVVALLYGIYVLLLARPVFLVFEYDRFRVVHAVDITDSIWANSEEGNKHSIWSPLETKALREFKSDKERSDATIRALEGFSLAFQSQLWSNYGPEAKGLKQSIRESEVFISRFPHWENSIRDSIKKISERSMPSDFVYVTMVDRGEFWTVFLDKQTLQPKFYLPVDSY